MNTYRFFCGIDVGKDRHVARVLDRDAGDVAEPEAFANDRAGFDRFVERLRGAGGPAAVRVGMEATAHYWYALHDRLRREGYDPVVLNPIQTAGQARTSIRKGKTDRIDARRIAVLLAGGDYRSALLPGEPGMTCRQLTRLWYELRRQGARIKQLLRCRIEAAWPEYESCFGSIHSPSSRAVLAAACTPADLLALDPDALADALRKASRGRLGAAKAQELRNAAAESIGTTRGLPGVRIGVRTLLAQLEALRPVRERLEGEIEELVAQLPPCVLTLPGADAVRAAALFGETDPVATFARPEQLVAFAGLDPVVFQSGRYDASRRRISKRGSSYLRRTLWTMARVAVQRPGELRNFYLAKRRRGLRHLAAVTAAALKLTRIAWRVLTDRRAYTPEPPRRPAPRA